MRLPYSVLRWMHRQKFSRNKLRGSKLHRWFGDGVVSKALWLPTRGSLARAWLVGFPITVVPFLPGQSILAIIAALMVRGNLLLCIALQFLSNPITAPVHLPVCYFAGELVRGRMPDSTWRLLTEDARHLLSADTVISLYLGSVVVGLIGGVVGYAVILRTWRDKPSRRDRGDESMPPFGRPRNKGD
ncbi:MAG: DUF2062 domain-containing protein [Opitutaceae bacterium]|nr:DUF2062 domain-containing protein [Opitutaceae bacterium]